MTTEHDKKEPDTTGHVWDGIREYDNPMPRWWLWTFYITIIWGIGYTIARPAWPLIEGATPGISGYSTRAEVAKDIEAVNEANAGATQELASIELALLSGNSELQQYAVNAGAAIFRANCSQCHGSGAAGVQASGYPNLLDDDWLWGGAIDDIAYTITHGIRNEQSPDSRWSQMPAFGEILSEEEIAAAVNYVRSISDQEHDAALAAQGAEIYLEQCSACHGEAGMGDPTIGAPNLVDAIWLYGGSEEHLTETITYSRFGVMPAWGEEYRPGGGGLDQAEINAVAAYVHQLGGGE
ncbi:MAG: cytochrome-c oxidase, cbb3-type subunit III [Rhodobacteraceae bacterium]|nr:cytochrome-c oxidase, cbb3-type subunit III [Paracoccaceae bacterium]